MIGKLPDYCFTLNGNFFSKTFQQGKTFEIDIKQISKNYAYFAITGGCWSENNLKTRQQ